MKNKYSIIISGIVLVLMFLIFSLVLYNNLKNDIIRNEHARLELEMPFLMKLVNSGIDYAVHCGSELHSMSNSDVCRHVLGDYIADDFLECREYSIVMKDSLVIVKKDTNIIVIPDTLFAAKTPLTDVEHVHYCILGFADTTTVPEDVRERLDFYKKLGYEYGYFETKDYLVNYRDSYQDYEYGFTFVAMKSKSVVMKQFNDFASLMFILVIVMIILIGIFLVFYTDANARLIKREENTKRERELMRINHLIGIERLSESIIHNINNPLTSAKGFLQLLLMEQPETAKNYRIKKILDNIEQVRHQTNAILSKTRRDMSEEKIEFSINDMLHEALDFHRNMITQYGIELKTDFDENIESVNGIFSDYSNIFDNLIDNAIDAMYSSERKILTVRTHKDENFIFVNVEDTGTGISEDVRDSIFDVYFTTKPLKRTSGNEPIGTGIGLYSVKRSAERNKLNIHVDSTPGKGTIFTVSIPV